MISHISCPYFVRHCLHIKTHKDQSRGHCRAPVHHRRSDECIPSFQGPGDWTAVWMNNSPLLTGADLVNSWRRVWCVTLDLVKHGTGSLTKSTRVFGSKGYGESRWQKRSEFWCQDVQSVTEVSPYQWILESHISTLGPQETLKTPRPCLNPENTVWSVKQKETF